MQLFAGELTNQNREYYKVNDNEYYLMGDLNCDLSSKELDHNSTKLMNIAHLYNLHQVIN